MYQNRAALESVSGFAAFISNYYWSSSVYNGNAVRRCIFYFGNGKFNDFSTNSSTYVRCVRDNLPVVTINQSVATAYKAAIISGYSLTTHPPFNYDGGAVSGTTGSDYKGKSSNATISTPYSIEVSKTQPSISYRYDTGAAKAECTKLGSSWRIPTQIELFAMYQNKSKLESISGFAAFISDYYWSSSVSNGFADRRCVLSFTNGNFNYSHTNSYNYVRCVRDI